MHGNDLYFVSANFKTGGAKHTQNSALNCGYD